jgi:hypothetical protein
VVDAWSNTVDYTHVTLEDLAAEHLGPCEVLESEE